MAEKKVDIKLYKNQLFKLLYGMYHVRGDSSKGDRGVPVMIWSNPGMGKTSTVEFLGKQLGVYTECRSGNKSDPVDFSGIPHMVGEGENKTVRYSLPQYAKNLTSNPDGILFLDELTTCTPVIQVALLSIIQDCKFGDFEIPKSVFRVAAGNYNNLTGTHTMSLALMNRFCHIHYNMDIDFFRDGFVSGWQNFEMPKINKKEDQVDKILKYKLAVANFLKEQPDFLNQMPEDGISNEYDVAYPTQRSWENAVKILAVLDENETGYIEELVKGVIGMDAGNFFMKFLQDYKGLGINIPDYADCPEKFRLPYPDRHDHVSQIMSSLVYYLNNEPQKYFELWVHVLNVLHNEGEKYGKYASYDNFIMRFLFPNIKMLLETKTINPPTKLKELKNRIPCYNLLGLLTSESR